MATKIAGETYLGEALHLPLSQDGQVSVYVWPMRILKSGCGGPTFGIDVGNEEVLRWDCHGERGHWHRGGYDKLGAGGSHVDFPEGAQESDPQVSWALSQMIEATGKLLADAGHAGAAEIFDAALAQTATDKIRQHIASQGDLMSKAVEKGLIKV